MSERDIRNKDHTEVYKGIIILKNYQYEIKLHNHEMSA